MNPNNVKWMFFYPNSDGTFSCCYDEKEVPKLPNGEDRNKVAVLTTSLYFGLKDVSKRMCDITKAMLFRPDSSPSELCVALPYREEVEDKTAHKAEQKDFADIAAYETFNEQSGVGFLTPTTGAEQIASAIQHGFNIHCQAGGVSLGAKLELVRDHFRRNPLPTTQRKPIIAGFSDGSEMQFGLAEISDYVHTGNAGRVFYVSPVFHKPTERALVEEVISTFESKEPKELQRTLKCDNPAIAQAVEQRYVKGERVRCLTYFPRQLISAINSPYRPQIPADQQLILGLEGYLQSEQGYNAHEALELALSQGVFKPEQIVAITIENIVAKEEELNIPRYNGHIPQFEKLTEEDKQEILKDDKDAKVTKPEVAIARILKKNNPKSYDPKMMSLEELDESVRSYIARSNAAYDNEVERIEAVARKYNIPVIFGGEVRAGHAYNAVSQPCYIANLTFKENGEIVATSLTRSSDNVQEIPRNRTSAATIIPYRSTTTHDKPYSNEPSVVYLGTNVPIGYEHNKEAELIAEDQSLNDLITSLQLVPANDAARKLLITTPLPTFAGNASNLSELPLEALQQKALFCIMPHREPGKGVHQSFDIIRLINSGRIGSSSVRQDDDCAHPKFVILSAQNAENCNNGLRKTIESLELETPIFLTTSGIKDLSKFPHLFHASIDLQRMLQPSTAPHPKEMTHAPQPQQHEKS